MHIHTVHQVHAAFDDDDDDDDDVDDNDDVVMNHLIDFKLKLKISFDN